MLLQIHAEILRRVNKVVDKTIEDYDPEKTTPFAVAWVGTSIQADDGGKINDWVFCDLKHLTKKEQAIAVNEMVKRTKALALVWVIPEKDQLSIFSRGPEEKKLLVFPVENGKLGAPKSERLN